MMLTKKTEHRRTDAFELWYWRRLLRVPWTARRTSQSVLQEICPEYALEVLMLKLGHLMQRADSLGKTLMLGKTEGRRRRGQQRMRWWMASPTWWALVWASCGSWWCTGKLHVLQSMGSQRVRHDWATELIRPRLWYFVAAAQMDSDNYYLSSSFDSKIWVRLKIYSSTYGLRLAEFENLKGLLANTASL